MKRVKRPSIPNKIRITPKVSYEVVYIDGFNKPDVVGEMRPKTQQIVIKNGLSNTELVKTVIHEVIHAVSDENGIGLTESQVGKLEHAVYRALRLNDLL